MPPKRAAPEKAPARTKRRYQGSAHRLKEEDKTGTHWDGCTHAELKAAAQARGLYRKTMAKAAMAKALAQHDQERKQPASPPLEPFQVTGPAFLEADDSELSSSSSSSAMEMEPLEPSENQRLCIYEWPFTDLPSPTPPKTPKTGQSTAHEVLPKPIDYAPMHVKTTVTQQSLLLPGGNYPERASSLPLLSQHVAAAARNGALMGALAHAIVERGTAWSKRTQVQGWNGRMYFANPSPPPKRELKSPRPRRHLPKLHLPHPICFVPGELNYPYEPVDVEQHARSLENLFYIRFSGNDLPSFYFWTWPGDWADPTEMNPRFWQLQKADIEFKRLEELSGDEARNVQARLQKISLLISPAVPVDEAKVRVKKSAEYQPGRDDPSKSADYNAALETFEKWLVELGLQITLGKLRHECQLTDQYHRWVAFSWDLAKLYSSGALPDTPPVHLVNEKVKLQSLSQKIAGVLFGDGDDSVPCMNGDEPWTRNDNVYWDVVSRRADDPYVPNRGAETHAMASQSESSVEQPFGTVQGALHKTWDTDFIKHTDLVKWSFSDPARFTALDDAVPNPIYSSRLAQYTMTQLMTLEAADERPLCARVGNATGQCPVCRQCFGVDGGVSVLVHRRLHRAEYRKPCPCCHLDWRRNVCLSREDHMQQHSQPVSWNVLHLGPGFLSLAARQPELLAQHDVPTPEPAAPPAKRAAEVTFASQVVERRIAYNGPAGAEPTAARAKRKSILKKAASVFVPTPVALAGPQWQHAPAAEWLVLRALRPLPVFLDKAASRPDPFRQAVFAHLAALRAAHAPTECPPRRRRLKAVDASYRPEPEPAPESPSPPPSLVAAPPRRRKPKVVDAAYRPEPEPAPESPSPSPVSVAPRRRRAKVVDASYCPEPEPAPESPSPPPSPVAAPPRRRRPRAVDATYRPEPEPDSPLPSPVGAPARGAKRKAPAAAAETRKKAKPTPRRSPRNRGQG